MKRILGVGRYSGFKFGLQAMRKAGYSYMTLRLED